MEDLISIPDVAISSKPSCPDSKTPSTIAVGNSPLTVYDTTNPQPSVGEVFHLFAQILRVLLVLARREDAAVDSVPAIPKNAEIGDSQPKLPY